MVQGLNCLAGMTSSFTWAGVWYTLYITLHLENNLWMCKNYLFNCIKTASLLIKQECNSYCMINE
jgi:hypothetical protein